MSMSQTGSTDYTLIIGSRSASSWSLRPWLLMRQTGIPFHETLVHLRRAESRSELAKQSPSGLVPALQTGGITIWDSLAISEFLAERHPDKALWPADAMTRAIARAVTAEMHSSFRDLRYAMPFDINNRGLSVDVTPGVANDIRRIVKVWRETRRDFGKTGPFLFGTFSIADAMYAPVASRFTSYAVDLLEHGDDGTAAAYGDHIMSLAAIHDWALAAAAEPPFPAA
jgi:glutathione S-transferase